MKAPSAIDDFDNTLYIEIIVPYLPSNLLFLSFNYSLHMYVARDR